jgi:hypothetical protein
MLVGGIEQEGERSLEPVGDLIFVRFERQVRRHDPKDWSDDITGDREVRVKRSNYVDFCGIEQDLFTGFPEGSLNRVFSGIDPAAREGDLPGMGSHMLPADGEDDARVCPVSDGDQDRRRNLRLGAKLRMIPLERRLGSGLDQRVAETLSERCPGAHAWLSKGKKAPALQMPGGTSPDDSAISASS